MEKEQIFAQLDFTMLRPGTSLQQVMAGAKTALDYGAGSLLSGPRLCGARTCAVSAA